MEWRLLVQNVKEGKMQEYIEAIHNVPKEYPDEVKEAKEAGQEKEWIFINGNTVYMLVAAKNMKKYYEEVYKKETVKEVVEILKPMYGDKREIIELEEIYDFEESLRKLNL